MEVKVFQVGKLRKIIHKFDQTIEWQINPNQIVYVWKYFFYDSKKSFDWSQFVIPELRSMNTWKIVQSFWTRHAWTVSFRSFTSFSRHSCSCLRFLFMRSRWFWWFTISFRAGCDFGYFRCFTLSHLTAVFAVSFGLLLSCHPHAGMFEVRFIWCVIGILS